MILQLQPLVPVHQFDKLPSYFILAGLVFIPLTQPYLHEYGEDWYNTSPRRLCERALRELPKKAGEQLVILSQVLSSHHHSWKQVKSNIYPVLNSKLKTLGSLKWKTIPSRYWRDWSSWEPSIIVDRVLFMVDPTMINGSQIYSSFQLLFELRMDVQAHWLLLWCAGWDSFLSVILP